MKTIDLTPTWSEILPTMLMLYRDGGVEGKRVMREEFIRMAQAADKWNAQAKKQKAAVSA